MYCPKKSVRSLVTCAVGCTYDIITGHDCRREQQEIAAANLRDVLAKPIPPAIKAGMHPEQPTQEELDSTVVGPLAPPKAWVDEAKVAADKLADKIDDYLNSTFF